MFERCLILLDIATEPTRAARAVGAFVLAAGGIDVLAHGGPQSAVGRATDSWEDLAERLEAGEAALAALTRALGDRAPEVRGDALLELTEAAIVDRVIASGAQGIVVIASGTAGTRHMLGLAQAAARATSAALVWVGPSAVAPSGPPERALCLVESDVRLLAPAGAFLAGLPSAPTALTVLTLREPNPPLGPTPQVLGELLGLDVPIAILRSRHSLFDAAAAVTEALAASAAELVIVPTGVTAGVSALAAWVLAPRALERLAVPVLFVPSRGPAPRADLDATDTLDLGDGRLRVHIDRLGTLGQPSDAANEVLQVVAWGRVVVEVTPDDLGAMVEVSPDPAPRTLGLGRRPAAGQPTVIEMTSAVVRLGRQPVVLVDASLSDEDLTRLARLWRTELDRGARRALAVRVRRTVAARKIRRRLAAAGLGDVPVVDASQVLDDVGLDVPDRVDPLRLQRVARYLRAAGVRVDTVAAASSRPDEVLGLLLLTPERLARLSPDEVRAAIAAAFVEPPLHGAGSSARLDELSGARLIAGNHVMIELDNAVGRRALLDVIAKAETSLHLEVYIVRDDALTHEVARALKAAAERGVAVRVLADSLHSGHGSFGARNDVLMDLAALPNIAVRAGRPIEGVPSVADLKQRDHRKVVIADGSVGIVTGRNLAAEYYTAFHEAEIGPDTPLRYVPWLDSGAVLRGPIVGALEAAFAAQWRAAGGEALATRSPPRAGDTPVRLVLHRGLADTFTLDTYLELIRSARDHITVVNTFPLQWAIVRALQGAIARDVRVTVLFGNVLPLFIAPSGERRRFPGSGAALRRLANQVVHGRIDTLVAAGAEAFELAVATADGEGPTFLPHAHAKVLSVDGRACTIGSANLDVTAGYWEDEAVAVIEDPEVAAGLEATLDALLCGSIRVDPEDPAWRQRAARRAWLSRHWPSLFT